MLTRKDAIAVGKAIVAGLKTEEARPELQGADNHRRYAARGATIHALDNIWYDVLTNQVKDAFDYNKELFYAACEWE